MITYLNGFAFILLQKQFNFKNDMKMFLDNPLVICCSNGLVVSNVFKFKSNHLNSTVLPIIAPNENKQNISKKVPMWGVYWNIVLEIRVKHIHCFQAACEFEIQIWVVNTFDVKISCWFWNWIAFIIFKNAWNIISTLYIYDHEILTLLFFTMMLFKFRL